MGRADPISVTVAIDTEEDDWGSYAEDGASVSNIGLLPEFQASLDRWGARPTYLVNRPPLVNAESVRVLGALAQRDDVEIGGHCHPWNTPPSTGTSADRSMMSRLTVDQNRGKIREITTRVEQELGVRPTTFRAGRWGFGPTVAEALSAEGYRVDSSVSPFMDWSADGGPDHTMAPHHPYRFHPAAPFTPTPDGPMVELPTTIGFFRFPQRTAGRTINRLERSWLAHLKLVGLLDVAGLLTRRWLSPETSSGEEMIKLARGWLASGERVLALTLHSAALLPGATPFVRSVDDRKRLLRSMETFLRYCADSGYRFRTLGETGRAVLGGGDRVAVED
ncbi:MAG TPA: hypothetical protein VK849_01355 [Longimicrobiales bacterium]|nr:hypothetical protein [Longimicrobiales bacterium]